LPERTSLPMMMMPAVFAMSNLLAQTRMTGQDREEFIIVINRQIRCSS
jgi:hypothetical protein